MQKRRKMESCPYCGARIFTKSVCCPECGRIEFSHSPHLRFWFYTAVILVLSTPILVYGFIDPTNMGTMWLLPTIFGVLWLFELVKYVTVLRKQR